MAKKIAARKTVRKPRADALRNRERILEVARHAFIERAADTSMDEIATLARIGPGTLYRHFPTRDDLLAAVFITEVEKLGEAQRKLSAELPPLEALQAWLHIFIDYVAAKRIIAPALSAMAEGTSRVFQHSARVMEQAANTLAARAVASGDIRPGLEPMDLLRALYGVCTGGNNENWLANARLFVDILIQGSRPPNSPYKGCQSSTRFPSGSVNHPNFPKS